MRCGDGIWIRRMEGERWSRRVKVGRWVVRRQFRWVVVLRRVSASLSPFCISMPIRQ